MNYIQSESFHVTKIYYHINYSKFCDILTWNVSKLRLVNDENRYLATQAIKFIKNLIVANSHDLITENIFQKIDCFHYMRHIFNIYHQLPSAQIYLKFKMNFLLICFWNQRFSLTLIIVLILQYQVIMFSLKM